jgi:hypothetical protein
LCNPVTPAEKSEQEKSKGEEDASFGDDYQDLALLESGSIEKSPASKIENSPKQMRSMSEEDTGMMSRCRDVYAQIQDVICADSFYMFEKDERLISKLALDETIDIYFQFILCPLRIPPNSKAKRRFSKYDSQLINILWKKTISDKTKRKHPYTPEKHNIQFFRAEKAMMLLFLRSNHNLLKKVNERHVDIFFEVLGREVLSHDNAYVDMSHVFKLIQFFIVQSPTESLRNILRSHLVYELLMHVDNSTAAETLIGLMTPGDNFFKIEDIDRKFISEYLYTASFGPFILKQAESFNIFSILKERLRVANLPAIQNFLNSLDTTMIKKSEKSKNFLVGYFHSLFNKDLMQKFHKQPEDIYTRILNIDRLPQNKVRPGITTATDKEQMRKLVKASTVGNLDKLYDVYEGEELKPDDLMEFEQINHMDAIHANLKLDKPPNFDGNFKAIGKITNSPKKKGLAARLFRVGAKAVMCVNLLLKRPQKKSKLKMAMKRNYTVYPENIPGVHVEVLRAPSIPSSYISECLQTEKLTLCLTELLHAVVSTAILNKTHGVLSPLIRLSPGNIELLNKFMFHTEEFLLTMLKIFVHKIPPALENHCLFASGYWAAKAFILVCRNMYQLVNVVIPSLKMPRPGIRQE